MKIDVERFVKQLDALTEQAFDMGWREKEFIRSVTDRMQQVWFNRQMAKTQASLFGAPSVEQQNVALQNDA